jgi:fatty acid desaturase
LFLSARTLNDIIGALCVNLYAWFDYKHMHKKHWEHHNECGTPHADPDFHKGEPSLLAWYSGFMKSYMSFPQFCKLQAISMGLMHYGHAPIANLLLFWTGAGMVSAIRLFYYGTYEPHKPDAEAWEGEEADGSMPWWKARTSGAGRLLSFLRCYHFDYHWEHHRWPTAPWWDLPRAREVKNAFVAEQAEENSIQEKIAARVRQQQQQRQWEREGLVEGGLVPAFEGMARRVSGELSRGASICLESVASLSSMSSMDLAYASMDA